MLLILFWGAVALIAYTYVGFPLLVMLRGWLFPRSYLSSEITPAISVVLVAHNEAAVIGAKLNNIAALDYPQDRLEVIVASDGSDDATNGMVERYRRREVKLFALPRQGKIPALNAAVARSTGEALVFTDANSMFAHDALRALVRPLADPGVGGVAGDQRYTQGDASSNAGERTYWNFDRMMKRAESAAGSAVSATGAIYAIRRELFRTVPSGVTDDFAVSTAVIAQGYRLVFQEDAIAYEPVAKSCGLEFGRKTRVINRGLRSVLARRALLNPWRYGFYSVQLFSHKVLRRMVFLPPLILLAGTPPLWPEGGWYQAAAVVKAGVYGCGVVGLLARQTWLGRRKIFAIPSFLCMVNAACVMACLHLSRGRRIELWEPQRGDTAPVAGVGQRRMA